MYAEFVCNVYSIYILQSHMSNTYFYEFVCNQYIFSNVILPHNLPREMTVKLTFESAYGMYVCSQNYVATKHIMYNHCMDDL